VATSFSQTSRSAIARLTRASAQYPALFLVVAAALAAVSMWLASHLRIDSSFAELLPEDVPSVRHVKELIKRVGGDGTVFVNIESLDGPDGLGKAQALAPVLTRDFLAMGPEQIRSVDENLRPVERWYTEHWPLFPSLAELEKARDAVQQEIKKQKIAANPLVATLDDEDAPAAAPTPEPKGEAAKWLDPKQPLPREQVAQGFARYVDGFMVHPDRRSLLLVVRPAGTSLGVSEARALLDRMQKVVDKHKAQLERDHLRVGFAGSFPTSVAEYEAIVQDVFGTAALVTAIVLASILVYFRDLRSTLSLGVAVLVALAITFGITQLSIGYLNTQTSFLGAIVVGNGINYGLIYLARVQQLRKAGAPVLEACLEGAQTTAEATLLASAATAVSYGVLIVAANRGFRHFGFIGGIGMLLCWVCTFALVPAVLVLWERVSPMRAAPVAPQQAQARLVAVLQRPFASPRTITAVFAVLTVIAAALFIRQIPTAMERNLDNLTNELRGQDQLRRDQDRAQTSLGKSIAGSIALLPSWPAADEFCNVIDKRAQEPRYSELIDGCRTLSSVVPRDQEKKLQVIAQIVKELPDSLLARLKPLERTRLREVRDQLAAQRQVRVEEAPPSLVDRFRERDGAIGRIAVVTAKPLAHIEEGPRLQLFVDSMRDVPAGGGRFDATGENVVLADLLKNIESEGPRTTLFSFLGVCALVLLFFRNLRTSVEVMGTLFVGVVLMAGAAVLTGIKINFFNFIVYPITFGIAVDYGANVAARVRERGGRVLEGLAEVGPVVALCSWTTLVGYGSLIFSLNRALRSFGWYAMIGELTSILTALLLLPALLLLARRHGDERAVAGTEPQ
jgi:predicted RND superfamily exporter protein